MMTAILPQPLLSGLLPRFQLSINPHIALRSRHSQHFALFCGRLIYRRVLLCHASWRPVLLYLTIRSASSSLPTWIELNLPHSLIRTSNSFFPPTEHEPNKRCEDQE
jgi:hypothetical protein